MQIIVIDESSFLQYDKKVIFQNSFSVTHLKSAIIFPNKFHFWFYSPYHVQLAGLVAINICLGQLFSLHVFCVFPRPRIMTFFFFPADHRNLKKWKRSNRDRMKFSIFAGNAFLHIGLLHALLLSSSLLLTHMLLGDQSATVN